MKKRPEKRPEWLKIKLRGNSGFQKVEHLLEDLNLNTVCKEANCPNRGECYSSGTATFMIMGRECTRKCRFCNVKDGVPKGLDRDEPKNVAQAVEILKLNYVVVTSVTRDDIEDGGADHFAKTIDAVKEIKGDVKIEVLIPDLGGDRNSLGKVLGAVPDVLNHNIETVPRLYEAVRPEAEYKRSLMVIRDTKEIDPGIKTKSGIMLGLGETRDEVIQVFKDLREHSCDLLTIGQYLSPSKEHYPVQEYITPEEFQWYREKALEIGFEGVAAGPLVRSSYKAWELFEREDDRSDTKENIA